MKKHIWLVVILIASLLCGCAESHEHNWKDANCVDPVTCLDCGATQGDPKGHSWIDASCTSAQKCSVCNQIQGEPLGHDWEDASCTAPKHCINCGKETGEMLDHSWIEASCTAPKMCEVCKTTSGEALEHIGDSWKTERNATCSEVGLQTAVCTVCGEALTREIATVPHKTSNWIITKEPNGIYNGTRVKECTVCGAEVESEMFNWTAEERAAQYKAACKSYTYNEIARNPGKYKGEMAKFTGKVIQVMQSTYGSTISYTLRVGIKNGYSYYTDVIYVTYTASEADARILEDDIITMYGELNGEKTYESTMGASITIPYFKAQYIDIK